MIRQIKFEEIMKRDLRRGEPIVKIGATGAGKTTLDECLAASEQTMELLSRREAEGKGSLVNTEIVICDDEAVPKDGLLVYGEMRRKCVVDVTDDNELFGNILYAGARELCKFGGENYDFKIDEALDNYLNHPANDSLAYQIMGMDSEIKAKLRKVLHCFKKSVLRKVYEEAKARNHKRGQAEKRIFIDLLGRQQENQDHISQLWTLVTDVINRDIEDFKDELASMGQKAYLIDNKSEIKFMVYLTSSKEDERFADFILRSEYGSKEYLFQNLSIIFRGQDRLFGGPLENLMVIGEVDGKAIHAIRLIDTQGILHPEGATVDSETERMVDILSAYHCRHVILVLNSCRDKVTKEADAVVEGLLGSVKADLNIHVLYTHFDMRLTAKNISRTDGRKFLRPRATTDWKAIRSEALAEQKDQIENFNKILNRRDGKRKPEIFGPYCAGIYTTIEKLDDLLEQNGEVYECAMDNILKSIYSSLKSDGARIRVSYCDDMNFENLFAPKDEVINVDALFSNLIECKGRKLYSATVRACNAHWIYCGDLHTSSVNENNSWGYTNVRTEFVREIRNISRSIIQNIDLNKFKPLVLRADQVDEFCALLTKAFTDNLGRSLARAIGRDSYDNAFCDERGVYKSYWQRFEQMLTYVQDNYFIANRVVLKDTPALVKAVNEAVAECVMEVVNTKCIVVY